MKGFALLVAALAGAALLYVTTAVGSQQAGPTRAEFNALKKQVAALKKDDVAIQTVLGACLTAAVPAARFSHYEARAADGTTFVTTGLDAVDAGETPVVYLLDVGQACAQVINSLKLNLHGFKLVRPAATQR
jgi:autotransporter adhesin